MSQNPQRTLVILASYRAIVEPRMDVDARDGWLRRKGRLWYARIVLCFNIHDEANSVSRLELHLASTTR